MTYTKLSILIPVYNEEKTISEILDKVHTSARQLGLDYEIVCVNDASSDGTVDILKGYAHDQVKIFHQTHNQGKGAAIAKAVSLASGDILLIQDADLEYDPQEYGILLAPILQGHADVVFGSRFLGGTGAHRALFFWHYVGNKLLTFLSNMFSNLNLTDMETCYKAFTRGAIEGMRIESKRFGIEPELTAKFAKRHCRIYEVPISYYGRNYKDGKKITWKDGFSALYCILKYNIFTRSTEP